jgi:hypothetical protein
LADLFQALRFTTVVVITCGLGFAAGARRPETALFMGWGLAILITVIAGGLFGAALGPVMAALGALGTLGLIRMRRGPRPEPSLAPRVLLLGLPLLLILLSLRTTAFDDFSFWGPNLLALCRTGHFPSLAHPLPASFMPAYPRGVALSGYATWLLWPDPSAAGQVRLLATGAWWNTLLMLAAATALAHNLARRVEGQGSRVSGTAAWAIAALAILLQSFLNPGFISKMTFSNMGDGATGSGFAMLAALLFELPDAGARARRVIAEMAFTAAAIVFIRQDNLALLLIWALGVAVGLWRSGGLRRTQRFLWLLLASLPALSLWLIWTRYTTVQIPGGAHSLLPFQAWHWADYPSTLRSAGRVLLSKGVYTLLAIGFGLAFLLMLAGRGPKKAASQWLLAAVTVLVFGNAAFIMFTYLASSFTPIEVRTAVTFWRFLAQTGPAEMVALACLLPLEYLQWLWRGRALPWALSLITALLPVLLVPTRYTFRTDLFYPTASFLDLGRSLASLLPANAPVVLLDNSDGSGYAAWMIKFGLQELGSGTMPVTLSLAPQLSGQEGDPSTIPRGTYVVLTQSQWRPPYFQHQGIMPWHAYLFHRDDTRFSLLQDWPIPRYGRKY